MRCTECGQEVESEPLQQLLAHCQDQVQKRKLREQAFRMRHTEPKDEVWVRKWVENSQKRGQRWESWAVALEAAVRLRDHGPHLGEDGSDVP